MYGQTYSDLLFCLFFDVIIFNMFTSQSVAFNIRSIWPPFMCHAVFLQAPHLQSHLHQEWRSKVSAQMVVLSMHYRGILINHLMLYLYRGCGPLQRGIQTRHFKRKYMLIHICAISCYHCTHAYVHVHTHTHMHTHTHTHT